MFQIERLNVVDKTFEQILSEINNGQLDGLEEMKAITEACSHKLNEIQNLIYDMEVQQNEDS